MIWREYVHHVHEVTDGFHLLDVNTTTPPNRTAGWPMDLQSDDTQHPNHLNQTQSLPMAYWGQTSGMDCLDWAVENVMDEAWTHHIPRLMVLSNLAQLMDIEPRSIDRLVSCRIHRRFRLGCRAERPRNGNVRSWGCNDDEALCFWNTVHQENGRFLYVLQVSSNEVLSNIANVLGLF